MGAKSELGSVKSSYRLCYGRGQWSMFLLPAMYLAGTCNSISKKSIFQEKRELPIDRGRAQSQKMFWFLR